MSWEQGIETALQTTLPMISTASLPILVAMLWYRIGSVEKELARVGNVLIAHVIEGKSGKKQVANILARRAENTLIG